MKNININQILNKNQPDTDKTGKQLLAHYRRLLSGQAYFTKRRIPSEKRKRIRKLQRIARRAQRGK